SPAGGKIECALPHIVVKIDLVVQGKLNSVDKPILYLQLVQPITPGIRSGCAESSGKNVIEPIEHERNIHLQRGYMFPPTKANETFCFVTGNPVRAHLSAIAIFQG